jgi:chromosome condensin MukBEF MukE localization factor
MSRTRALLRYGLWPDIPALTKEPVELTAAAKAQGLNALEALHRLGVVVTVDDGKARFRLATSVQGAGKATALSPAARRVIERDGDLIETTLVQTMET